MEGLDRRQLLERAGGVALGLGIAAAVPEWALAGGPTSGQLKQLARQLKGPVVTPSNPAYARDRQLVNQRYDGVHPAAIAYCENVSDVQKTVTWARNHGIHIVPRCGRHSYAGYSTTSGVVVDVSRMSSVHPSGGTAVVGAGAILTDVYTKLWAQHRTIPGGSCPTVGIAGLTQGGGIGYASRKFGTTADNVKQLTIVTADGKARVCNAKQNSDLYWACRGGGGGNFGIVTSFVFETHPVSNVSTFYITWPWSSAARVVRAWQSFAPHASRSLFSVCILSGSSSGSRSVSAQGQFFGSLSALRRLLRPLLVGGASLSIKQRSYIDAVMYYANCSSLSQCRVLPRETFKAKSDYCLKPLSGKGISTLLDWIPRTPGGTSVILDSYGGAINAVPKAATAFAHRDALFSMQYYQGWGGSGTAANLSFIRSFYKAMRPFVSGYAYVNYIDPDLTNWPHAYYGSNYPRLVKVKRKYDPHNIFNFPQSIRLKT